MRTALATALGLLCAGCATPLEVGQRLYGEGDRLGALETWRAVPETEGEYEEVRARIGKVEEEIQQLVAGYQKEARDYEHEDQLAKSILNYRLALKLQPHDEETLDHVQQLARQLAGRKAELEAAYQIARASRDLAAAREQLDELLKLDSLDPELEIEDRQLHDELESEVAKLLTAGRRQFSAGHYAAAMRTFYSVLELDKENETAEEQLSYIATMVRVNSGSEEQRAGFESLTPSDAESYYQKGLRRERKGKVHAAISFYQLALEADPNHQESLKKLASLFDSLLKQGLASFREEDLEEALKRWRIAERIDPDNEYLKASDSKRLKAYIERARQQIEDLKALRSEPDVAAGVD